MNRVLQFWSKSKFRYNSVIFALRGTSLKNIEQFIMPHNIVFEKFAWIFFAFSFWQGERQAYQSCVCLSVCLLKQQTRTLAMRVPAMRWHTERLCWSAIRALSKQTKPSLSPLSALTSAERWDNWGLCLSKSIIITQSIKMLCLLICIKIYCASDISRLWKIYISQHTSSFMFLIIEQK